MLTEENNSAILRLLDIMAKLRSPEGCPWDRQQTHQSLKPYLMEECAELMDAIEDHDIPGIREELGDLLLHIVFICQIATEDGLFTFDEVVEYIVEKMLRRHPHVFGDNEFSADHPDQVVEIWEEIKRREKKIVPKSVLDNIPRHLPSLLRARKIQKTVAKYGFDWDTEPQIIEKIEEELSELKTAINDNDDQLVEEEIGDLLFAVVNLSRFRNGPTGDELLIRATRKFQTRFRFIEDRLAEKGRKLEESSLDEMESLWQKAKELDNQLQGTTK